MKEFVIAALAIIGAVSLSGLFMLACYLCIREVRLWWRMKEIRKVDAVYPGWRSVVASHRFMSWLERQPADVARKQMSYRSKDAIDLLTLYNADH